MHNLGLLFLSLFLCALFSCSEPIKIANITIEPVKNLKIKLVNLKRNPFYIGSNNSTASYFANLNLEDIDYIGFVNNYANNGKNNSYVLVLANDKQNKIRLGDKLTKMKLLEFDEQFLLLQDESGNLYNKKFFRSSY